MFLNIDEKRNYTFDKDMCKKIKVEEKEKE